MLNFCCIYFQIVPLCNSLFNPFPSNFQSSFHIMSFFAFACFFCIFTKAFHHSHELRDKICHFSWVFSYVLFDDVEFFEFRWRILLINHGFWSFFSWYLGSSGTIVPKIWYWFLIVLFFISFQWAVTLTFSSFIFLVLILKHNQQMFHFSDFFKIFSSLISLLCTFFLVYLKLFLTFLKSCCQLALKFMHLRNKYLFVL